MEYSRFRQTKKGFIHMSILLEFLILFGFIVAYPNALHDVNASFQALPNSNVLNSNNPSNINQQNQTVIIAYGASNPSSNQFYYPSSLSVQPGTNVSWTNNDDSQNHTVTFLTADLTKPSGEFNSGIIPPNQKRSHVFSTIGTFNYYCQIHPYMTGRIIVSFSP
jgi:plastocyanin